MSRQDWVEKALELSRELLALAEDEGGNGDDDEDLILQGILRESAFKIRKVARGLREYPPFD